MSVTTNYLIEPLAPLVFRSGKPFGSQSSANDVIFPLPSAAAGLVRATSISQKQIAMNEHQVKGSDQALQDDSYKKVLSIKTRGPYLARFDNEKEQVELLVPKPADALYFEAKDSTKDNTPAQVKLIRLAPEPLDADCGSDLPNGLLPVQMSEKIKGKPKPGVAYWTVEYLKRWQAGDNIDFEELQKAGVASLPIEIRTHVAIDSKTQAAKTGQLFQTASLDLGYSKLEEGESNQKHVWQNKRLGFVVQTQQSLTEDTVTFGGERRLSKFSPVSTVAEFYDDSLESLLNQINTSKGFRLTFITPCVFSQGYLPSWIDEDSKEGKLPDIGASVRLKACAIDRWQPISGWDSIVWKPKAMRKAVSSGSVYWFELIEDLNLEQLQQLTDLIWSDDKQDKNDGFGVALIAPWASI